MTRFILRAVVTVLLLAPIGAHAATITVFNALIDSDQANMGMGTGTGGKGAATMALNHDTNEFSWFIAWQNLAGEVIAGHFHGPAPAGQNADVEVGFDHTTNPTSGSEILSAQQAADLLNGLWYINIHTDLFQGGEIRGQVLAISVIPVPAAIWLFGSAFALLLGMRRHTP